VADEALSRGREAFQDRAWESCWSALSDADLTTPLDADDLVLLSLSAYLSGRDQESADALSRAFHSFETAARWREAARSAFWLAFMLLNAGEVSLGSGWATRSQRLVERHDLGGAEAGFLVSLEAHRLVSGDRPADGLVLAEKALSASDEADDPDLRALALLTAGHALARMNRVPEALARFDEVMVSVSADELTPTVTGLAYCSSINASMQLLDLARARQWTSALTSWCDGQPGLVPYRGQCLVHRGQILMLQGDWPDALEQTRSACDLLREPLVADAYYLLGELHRVRGEHDAAEDAFRQANSWGRRPEPGLVRLRLAQGRVDAAATTVRRLLTEETEGRGRAAVLAAGVEVLVEARDLDLARRACEELSDMVTTTGSPVLEAHAAQATGAVLLADGQPDQALAVLRRAWRAWQDLELPYDAARVRVLLGRCLREVGDEDSALMELDAARWAFDRLGAVHDVALVDALAGSTASGSGGLTPREVDVIRLVASGRTNRAVAHELFLSEKTVARHLSNIYAKLDISSRAAATAYAYDHGLV